MTLTDRVRTVHSREKLAEFIDALREDLSLNVGRWENRDLDSYLEAMGGWVRDMDGFYRNRGEETPSSPSWGLIAEILLAAKYYE